MHVDEAVHAVKFGHLLEDGYYRYDPVEYHGPSLNYLTLIPAWLAGRRTIQEIDEALLRSVPAFAGLLLILAFLSLRRDLGWEFVLAASLLTSLSAFVVYYNRYYIQESLFVSFFYAGIISLYRYARSGKLLPLASAAVLFALCYASKETFVISVIAGAVSWALASMGTDRRDRPFTTTWSHFALFIVIFSFTAAMLFSSFFSNPGGISDSFRSLGNYFSKANAFPGHHHPWYYYLSVVAFADVEGFPYSEALMVVLFVAGSYYLLRERRAASHPAVLLRAVAWFTILTAIVYSAIPYKTPWTMFTFWQGILIVAAYAAVRIRAAVNRKVFFALASLVCLHLGLQTWRTAFTSSCHPRNPFVYAHTTNDVVEMSELIREMSASQDTVNPLGVYVAAKDNDYWPLPWYLRALKRVSWNSAITADACNFDVVLAFPEYEPALAEALYSLPSPGEVHLYVPLFESYRELRPGAEIRGYVRKSVLDRYERSKTLQRGGTR